MLLKLPFNRLTFPKVLLWRKSYGITQDCASSDSDNALESKCLLAFNWWQIWNKVLSIYSCHVFHGLFLVQSFFRALLEKVQNYLWHLCFNESISFMVMNCWVILLSSLGHPRGISEGILEVEGLADERDYPRACHVLIGISFQLGCSFCK